MFKNRQSPQKKSHWGVRRIPLCLLCGYWRNFEVLWNGSTIFFNTFYIQSYIRVAVLLLIWEISCKFLKNLSWYIGILRYFVESWTKTWILNFLLWNPPNTLGWMIFTSLYHHHSFQYHIHIIQITTKISTRHRFVLKQQSCENDKDHPSQLYSMKPHLFNFSLTTNLQNLRK